MPLSIAYDEAIVEMVATKFDLRTPNREALAATIRRLADGNYENALTGETVTVREGRLTAAGPVIIL